MSGKIKKSIVHFHHNLILPYMKVNLSKTHHMIRNLNYLHEMGANISDSTSDVKYQNKDSKSSKNYSYLLLIPRECKPSVINYYNLGCSLVHIESNVDSEVFRCKELVEIKSTKDLYANSMYATYRNYFEKKNIPYIHLENNFDFCRTVNNFDFDYNNMNDIIYCYHHRRQRIEFPLEEIIEIEERLNFLELSLKIKETNTKLVEDLKLKSKQKALDAKMNNIFTMIEKEKLNLKKISISWKDKKYIFSQASPSEKLKTLNLLLEKYGM